MLFNKHVGMMLMVPASANFSFHLDWGGGVSGFTKKQSTHQATVAERVPA